MFRVKHFLCCSLALGLLSGVASSEVASGSVTDKDKRPLARAKVRITLDKKTWNLATNAKGNFQVPLSKRGTYHVTVTRTGYQPVRRDWNLPNRDVGWNFMPIRLIQEKDQEPPVNDQHENDKPKAGQDASKENTTKPPVNDQHENDKPKAQQDTSKANTANPPINRNKEHAQGRNGTDVTVSGRVTNEDGSPLPDVTIIITGASKTYKTNELGEYTTSLPAAQEYQVQAQLQGYKPSGEVICDPIVDKKCTCRTIQLALQNEERKYTFKFSLARRSSGPDQLAWVLTLIAGAIAFTFQFWRWRSTPLEQGIDFSQIVTDLSKLRAEFDKAVKETRNHLNSELNQDQPKTTMAAASPDVQGTATTETSTAASNLAEVASPEVQQDQPPVLDIVSYYARVRGLSGQEQQREIERFQQYYPGERLTWANQREVEFDPKVIPVFKVESFGWFFGVVVGETMLCFPHFTISLAANEHVFRAFKVAFKYVGSGSWRLREPAKLRRSGECWELESPGNIEGEQ